LEQAARNSLVGAEREARLVGLWTERLPTVIDGDAQAQVFDEYLIARPR
jgi:hypothetical protein